MSTTMNNEERCAILSHPDIPETFIAIFLLIWLVVGYAPQYFRMWRKQSARGLSPLFLLIGCIAGVCGVANIIALPSSRQDMGCCKTNTTFACMAGLLGITTIIVGFGFYLVLVGLYVYYTRMAAEQPTKSAEYEDEEASDAASTTSSAISDAPSAPLSASQETIQAEARQATNLVTITLIWSLVIMGATAVILDRFPAAAYTWANVLGLTQMALACVQWFPQIWMTWKLQSLGSLSAIGLWLGTPGTFVFLWSIFMRVGWRGWSVWIVIVVIALAQTVLLGMATTFSIRKWRARTREAGRHGEVGQVSAEGEADEHTSLLKRAADAKSRPSSRKG